MFSSDAGKAMACRCRVLFSSGLLVFSCTSFFFFLFLFIVNTICMENWRECFIGSATGDSSSNHVSVSQRFVSLVGKNMSPSLSNFKISGKELYVTKRFDPASKISKSPQTSPLLSLVDLQSSLFFKPKSAVSLELELNLTHATRPMESSCFAILVVHEPHRVSVKIEQVLNMATEGLPKCHQAPSVALFRSYHRSLSLHAQKTQTSALFLSAPIIFSPPSSCTVPSLIWIVTRKLGLLKLGLAHYSPLVIYDGLRRPNFVTGLTKSRKGLIISIIWLGDGMIVGPNAAASSHITCCKFKVFLFLVPWTYYVVHLILSPRTFDGFTGYASGLYLLTMSNHSFKRILQFSSHWERSFSPSSFKERTLPTWCISMRYHLLSIIISKNQFIFVKAFASLEDAFGLILMINPMTSGARRCYSKLTPQDVTRLFLWSLTTMSPSTHLSYATNSLSLFFESLSSSFSFQFNLYCIKQRGWIILSLGCILQD